MPVSIDISELNQAGAQTSALGQGWPAVEMGA